MIETFSHKALTIFTRFPIVGKKLVSRTELNVVAGTHTRCSTFGLGLVLRTPELYEINKMPLYGPCTRKKIKAF